MHYIETLLKHLFKLVTEREGNLCGDEPLEDAANYAEHHHLYDTLDVLAKHVVHHVRVGHHVQGVCRLDFPVQVAVRFVAVERFANFDGLFRQPLSILADPVAPYEGLTFFGVLWSFFLQLFN